MPSRALAALILITPLFAGCTLIGAGIGAATPKPPSYVEGQPRAEVVPVGGPRAARNQKKETYALEGALIGAAVDIAVVIAVTSALSDVYEPRGDMK